jgi:hypothetical protein
MGVPASVTPFDETDYDAESILEAYSPDRYLDIARRHGDLFGHD